jgi:hypothetical protein
MVLHQNNTIAGIVLSLPLNTYLDLLKNKILILP